ncbi:NUDIX hydrolase [Salinigranum sp. GCM10025319]|uniref:NUDIX hydrolase n=1 Tax=Salinigranum sp. GCM10025319 TaxID=3252687 RepID=UPI003605EB11
MTGAPNPNPRTDAETNAADVRFAAGGLLWRDADGGRRLAVVHRPRYDDWTLPKGKPEADEPLDETALREVREETGCAVERGRFAGTVTYETDAGPKVVLFWRMTLVEEGTRETDGEVDEVAWLTPEEARTRLSYPAERAILDHRPVTEVLAPATEDVEPDADAEPTDRSR